MPENNGIVIVMTLENCCILVGVSCMECLILNSMYWFGPYWRRVSLYNTQALESNGLVTFAAWHNSSLAEDTAL